MAVIQNGDTMWTRTKRAFACFREHLTVNEVIFRTVAATGLTGMALIVSITQLRVSSEQMSIAEAQALPRFEIGIHQVMNPDTKKYDDNVMDVVNAGGAVPHFRLETAAFIQVNIANAQNQVMTVAYPVTDYFRMQGEHSRGTGELATVTGYRNNADFVTLERQIRKIADEQHITVILGIWTYAYVRYTDILNRDHAEYYFVPAVGLAIQMPDDEGKRVYARYNDYSSDRLVLENLKPEALLQMAMKTFDTKQKPFRLP